MLRADVLLQERRARSLRRRLVGVAITAALVAGGVGFSHTSKPEGTGSGTAVVRSPEQDTHSR